MRCVLLFDPIGHSRLVCDTARMTYVLLRNTTRSMPRVETRPSTVNQPARELQSTGLRCYLDVALQALAKTTQIAAPTSAAAVASAKTSCRMTAPLRAATTPARRPEVCSATVSNLAPAVHLLAVSAVQWEAIPASQTVSSAQIFHALCIHQDSWSVTTWCDKHLHSSLFCWLSTCCSFGVADTI
jgi:hypothetical protein